MNPRAFLGKYVVSVFAIVSATMLLIAFLIAFVPLMDTPTYGSIEFPDDTRIIVEIADEPDEQEKGLSGRAEIQESFGLLFVFDKPWPYAFWMKDMHFPIDIIWLRGDEVVHIETHLPPEGAFPTFSYAPSEPADRVLEVRAGFAARHGLVPGERLDITLD